MKQRTTAPQYNYVQNRVSVYRSNFNKKSKADVDSLGSPYDLYSVMHYEDDAFSENGKKTITTKDGRGFNAQVRCSDAFIMHRDRVMKNTSLIIGAEQRIWIKLSSNLNHDIKSLDMKSLKSF